MKKPFKIRPFLLKFVSHIFSWKFQLLVLSTVLFIKGTLSENGWLMMAASTTGLRELVNLMTLKLSNPQRDDNEYDYVNHMSFNGTHPGGVDNPDAN